MAPTDEPHLARFRQDPAFTPTLHDDAPGDDRFEVVPRGLPPVWSRKGVPPVPAHYFLTTPAREPKSELVDEVNVGVAIDVNPNQVDTVEQVANAGLGGGGRPNRLEPSRVEAPQHRKRYCIDENENRNDDDPSW